MATVKLQVPLLPLNRVTGPVTGTAYRIDRQGFTSVDPSDVEALVGQGYSRSMATAALGTASTGVTAAESGTDRLRQTILTVSTTLPAIAGGANLAVGKLLYTFPAGEIIVDAAYMSVAITQSQGNITADTPDVGIGTVIGSGVVAVLGGTATFENILTGQTAADCNGTATVKTLTPTANVPLVIATAGAHTVYLNVADGWAASGDAAAGLAGTVILHWRRMSA